LPPELRAEILISLIESMLDITRNPDEKPKNLEEYFIRFFGKKSTKLYLKPYNEKYGKDP